jgi:hypothetical protein
MHRIIIDKFLKEIGQTIKNWTVLLVLLVPADLFHPLTKILLISFKYCGLMPSKPGEEPAGKELIASRTFCSLTIKKSLLVLQQHFH